MQLIHNIHNYFHECEFIHELIHHQRGYHNFSLKHNRAHHYNELWFITIQMGLHPNPIFNQSNPFLQIQNQYNAQRLFLNTIDAGSFSIFLNQIQTLTVTLFLLVIQTKFFHAHQNYQLIFLHHA